MPICLRKRKSASLLLCLQPGDFMMAELRGTVFTTKLQQRDIVVAQMDSVI